MPNKLTEAIAALLFFFVVGCAENERSPGIFPLGENSSDNGSGAGRDGSSHYDGDERDYRPGSQDGELGEMGTEPSLGDQQLSKKVAAFNERLSKAVSCRGWTDCSMIVVPGTTGCTSDAVVYSKLSFPTAETEATKLRGEVSKARSCATNWPKVSVTGAFKCVESGATKVCCHPSVDQNKCEAAPN